MSFRRAVSPLGLALFVLAMTIPVIRAGDPEPEEPLVCTYSTALGFNPWERFHVVGLEGNSELGGSIEVQGRIIGPNLVVGGGCRVNSNPGKTDQYKFAVTAAGTLTMDTTSVNVYNGGLDAFGNVAVGAGNTVYGDLITQGTAKVYASGRIFGNVNAVGKVTLGGSCNVNGNVHTNADVSITESSRILGSLIAGGSLELNSGGQIYGPAAVANDDGYDQSNSNVRGILTVTATLPAMTIPFSTDFAAVKAYFEGRSAAWKELEDSVVNVRVIEAPSGFTDRRVLHVRLHSKVNVYTVTREVLLYVSKIVLAGHPGGFLILNVPGTADFDLQYKRVFTSDKDGVESHPAFGRLLLNFFETTGNINIGNVHYCMCSTPGMGQAPASMSILAPLAKVVTGPNINNGISAYLKGNIIAKSFELSSGSTIYTQPFGTTVRSLVPPPPRPPTAPSVNSGKLEFLCMWHKL